MMMRLAAVTGQFAGGALVALSPWGLGWRAVFLVNLPIGAAALIGAWLLLPETSARTPPDARYRWRGVALAGARLPDSAAFGGTTGWMARLDLREDGGEPATTVSISAAGGLDRRTGRDAAAGS